MRHQKRETGTGKAKHGFLATYKFPDGKDARTATASDWEKSASLHEKQANALFRTSENCLYMAERVRKAEARRRKA